ncbi:DMT family transporter [Marinomonas fungiae]|uniref:Threonine/homoserine efflux transporter RhtA n=1 Tax=Marinomonas fungiae TaxID=1137284 RepID=A0A0K6IMY4_9GAMM|nr:EamA family transporter [Marinomonas fungiae]CUB04463.1 Threonine/homoserine efflux transporter RhtA [Marinomonas fungiae]
MTTATANTENPQAGHIAILLASFLWGSTGTVASFAHDVSPLAIGAFAMGVGGLLQALVALKNLQRDTRKLWRLKAYVVLGALGIAVYPLTFYSAMHLAGVAIGTVVTIGSAPFASALLEWLISKKSPFNRIWLISLLLGLLGMLLLAFSGAAPSQSTSDQMGVMIGILLGLIAGASYALYAWTGKRMMEEGVHSKAAMSSMFVVSALILLPSLIIIGDQLFANLNNISVALYMAGVPMFLGYVLFGFGLKTTQASTATVLTLFEPVVAAIFAVTIVGEQLGVSGWLGMAFIGVCLWLQTRTSKQTSPIPETP